MLGCRDGGEGWSGGGDAIDGGFLSCLRSCRRGRRGEGRGRGGRRFVSVEGAEGEESPRWEEGRRKSRRRPSGRERRPSNLEGEEEREREWG